MDHLNDQWDEPEQQALRAVLNALEEGEQAASKYPEAFHGDLGRAGAAMHLMRDFLEANSCADPEDMALLLAK